MLKRLLISPLTWLALTTAALAIPTVSWDAAQLLPRSLTDRLYPGITVSGISASMQERLLIEMPGDPRALGPRPLVAQVRAVPWVKDAEVRHGIGSPAHLQVIPRVAVAQLVSEDGSARAIDEGGIVYTPVRRLSPGLPVVEGQGAAEALPALLAALSREPEIAERFAAARRIGNRRWDIYLKHGPMVRLPEDRVPDALETSLINLATLSGDGKLLGERAQSIDLRVPDRILVTAETIQLSR